jgi:hypothetical protein
MAEADKLDRKPRESRIRGMSLYAISADYERRLSEVDCVQELERGIAGKTSAEGVRRGQQGSV